MVRPLALTTLICCLKVKYRCVCCGTMSYSGMMSNQFYKTTIGSPFGWRTLPAYCPPTFPTRTVSRTYEAPSTRERLTSWLIIAHSEIRRNIGCDTSETIGAVLSVTSDFGGSLPYDLRKVTPSLEICHVWFAIIPWIEHHFVVVHLVGDHSVYLTIWSSCTNVLAISSATSLGVVRVLAA